MKNDLENISSKPKSWQELKSAFERLADFKEKLNFWKKNNLFNSVTPLSQFNPDSNEVDKHLPENFISIYVQETKSDIDDYRNNVALAPDSKISLLMDCVIEWHSESFTLSSNQFFEKDLPKHIPREDAIKIIKDEIRRVQKLKENEWAKFGYDLNKEGDKIIDIHKVWLFSQFNSPFFREKVFYNLCDGFKLPKHEKLLLDKLQELESPNQSKKLINAGAKKKTENRNFSHKQIAIAYFFLDIVITAKKAGSILKKHSKNTSIERLMQEKIFKPSELTKLSENKTTDTKHLQDLEAAKLLARSEKNKKAVAAISEIIRVYKEKYNSKY